SGTNELTILITGFVMCLVGAALALPRLGLPMRIGALAGGVLLFAVVTLVAFYGWRAPLPVAMPVLGYFAGFFLTAAAVRRFARGARTSLFERFRDRTSDANLRRIVTDALDVQLDGDAREITVMITNLTNFTKTAERLNPQDIVAVMNGYLEGICATVAKYDGVVDRVNVDSVVSIFGAPLDQADHASRAVHCALAVDDFAEGYRERRMTDAGRLSATRIGLHTGDAVVGNFGGDGVFAYSAHGDTVRTAGRMQAANKVLGTRICASSDTARAATDIIFRPIGKLRWRNENEAVDAFEPLPESKSETPEIEAYIRAYRLVQCEDDAAAGELARAIQIAPHDPLLKLYKLRLSQRKAGTTLLLDS
ncbi:MAG: adenylate/guanylate cyclase domain-containing protein, partial [Alphaproteobacteria bacterium]|nr:adenylate/guanylate cyclase domain-containing protein [Alphaproteobacteria bacterium]